MMRDDETSMQAHAHLSGGGLIFWRSVMPLCASPRLQRPAAGDSPMSLRRSEEMRVPVVPVAAEVVRCGVVCWDWAYMDNGVCCLHLMCKWRSMRREGDIGSRGTCRDVKTVATLRTEFADTKQGATATVLYM